ncbi:MAG: helix-turn-helix transcriptional regulator [Clostridia bacterium]|nr:helix-turn-helix transcriptional regulator [Clostridia bacterium]
MTVGEKIKEYRRANNLSQSAFGEMLGVTPQAVCKWEQNLCYPDIFTLPHLARILGCQTDDFFRLPSRG